MLSLLLTIAQYVVVIAALVILLVYFVPILWTWLTWAFSAVYILISTVPDWVAPFFLVCVILALISLGVKLL